MDNVIKWVRNVMWVIVTAVAVYMMLMVGMNFQTTNSRAVQEAQTIIQIERNRQIQFQQLFNELTALKSKKVEDVLNKYRR